MKISSDTLKEKLKYLGFGISKNSTDPIRTKVIRFSSDGTNVYAFTNDGVNSLKVLIGQTNDDFTAMTDYAQFVNVIKSCDGDIELKADNKSISIKTSIMKAKVPVYNSATPISNPSAKNFPTPDKELTKDFRLGLIKLILNTSHVVTAYQKVYFGDNIMTSDTDNVLIVKDRIFDRDIMLNSSSIELLSNISNIKYTYLEGKTLRLYVFSDELEAVIEVDTNDDGDFQYEDMMELFNDINGASTDIDTGVLSKAISTSQLFKKDPVAVFNATGIYLNIDSSDFSYKISDKVCEDRQFILTPSIAKKICSIGDHVTMYYTNKDVIRCDFNDVSEILSVTEVTVDG